MIEAKCDVNDKNAEWKKNPSHLVDADVKPSSAGLSALEWNKIQLDLLIASVFLVCMSFCGGGGNVGVFP